MSGAGRKGQLDRARKSVEQTKKAMRRDGYNRGVRAASRLAMDCWSVGTESREQAESTSKSILKLLKPKIDNPNFSIVPY